MAPVEPLRTAVAPRSVHVPLAQTTQPRYPATPHLPDAPHLVLVVGDLTDHGGHDDHGHRVRRLTTADEAGPALDDELARLTTGWRLAAVGTERDAQAVRAAALARGALDEEITVIAVDGRDDAHLETARVRRVHCGRCHHGFDARAAIGDAVACPGCGTEVAVAGHFSARHGAFLGAPV